MIWDNRYEDIERGLREGREQVTVADRRCGTDCPPAGAGHTHGPDCQFAGQTEQPGTGLGWAVALVVFEVLIAVPSIVLLARIAWQVAA